MLEMRIDSHVFMSEEELKQLSLKKTSTERKFKCQLRKQQLLRLKYMNQS
jgi:hypothetical protein